MEKSSIAKELLNAARKVANMSYSEFMHYRIHNKGVSYPLYDEKVINDEAYYFITRSGFKQWQIKYSLDQLLPGPDDAIMFLLFVREYLLNM